MNRIALAALILSIAAGNPPASAADSNDRAYSAPASSFKASSDVRLLDTSKAQNIAHKNVTVDDTRTDNAVELQERTEFESTNTIKVLNNMGSTGNLYTADQLESKTGKPTTKQGLEKIPHGSKALFSGTGTQIIPAAASKEGASTAAEEEPSAKQAGEKKKAARVLIS